MERLNDRTAGITDGKTFCAILVSERISYFGTIISDIEEIIAFTECFLLSTELLGN